MALKVEAGEEVIPGDEKGDKPGAGSFTSTS